MPGAGGQPAYTAAMAPVPERTVLFADLRGSTRLFESLGNAPAAALVAGQVARLVGVVQAQGGRVVKTLGDGLLAVFDAPDRALAAAQALRADASGAGSAGALQVAIGHGELAELGGDCYGDAVNVTARLLAHAGDGEILLTAAAAAALPAEARPALESLGRLQLRGRQAPVEVLRLAEAEPGGPATALFAPSRPPPGRRAMLSLRLRQPPPGAEASRRFLAGDRPLTLGRQPGLGWVLPAGRVSRVHARLDWNGTAFELLDLSRNGSLLRLEGVAGPGPWWPLHRQSGALQGRGQIVLGGPPEAPDTATLDFEVGEDPGA